MEPYETRAPDGTPIYYYPDQHLVPPPPPRRKHILLILVIVWLSVVLILVSATAVILYERQIPAASVPTATSTPTLLQTADFSKFYEVFSDLMNHHDYAAIQSATDTENFQAIALRTSSGTSGWYTIHNQLTSGQLSFSLVYPPFTPDRAGDSCFGYGPTGIAYLDLTIDAFELQYVVGTASTPSASSDDPFVAPYGTVFVFELPNGPSPTWLWRAVTFNNSLGCG